MAVADLNFDFKNDLVAAGPKGLRIYQQQDPNHFTDVTAGAHLPPDVVNGSYTGAWPFDFDLDGDLDIVLGVSGASPLVLRNNGDGTFTAVRPFNGPQGVSSLAIADVAGLTAPDIAMVGQDGRLSVFMNERHGQYRARAVPPNLAEGVLAVAEGDVDGDGLLDFVVWKSDGTVVRLSDKNDGQRWDTAELAKANAAGVTVSNARLAVADFDNNGTLDLLVGDGQVFLGSASGFTRLNNVPPIVGPCDHGREWRRPARSRWSFDHRRADPSDQSRHQALSVADAAPARRHCIR